MTDCLEKKQKDAWPPLLANVTSLGVFGCGNYDMSFGSGVHQAARLGVCTLCGSESAPHKAILC